MLASDTMRQAWPCSEDRSQHRHRRELGEDHEATSDPIDGTRTSCVLLLELTWWTTTATW